MLNIRLVVSRSTHNLSYVAAENGRSPFVDWGLNGCGPDAVHPSLRDGWCNDQDGVLARTSFDTSGGYMVAGAVSSATEVYTYASGQPFTHGGDSKQLSHYRQTFGPDYHSFSTTFATFVLVNSESLIVPELGLNGTRDPGIINETSTQWSWLERTLAQASASGRHVILVTHHPPFLTSPNEKHNYWNWPLAIRTRLLSLLKAHGVRNVLCGHTHTTTNRTVDGLSIFTVAGTARAFDGNGCGYRVLRITREEVASRYVPLTNDTLEHCNASGASRKFDDELAINATAEKPLMMIDTDLLTTWTQLKRTVQKPALGPRVLWPTKPWEWWAVFACNSVVQTRPGDANYSAETEVRMFYDCVSKGKGSSAIWAGVVSASP